MKIKVEIDFFLFFMYNQSWQEEVLVYQEEMEGLSLLAQQVMDETHISSQISTRATKITARYHILLLHLLVTFLQLYTAPTPTFHCEYLYTVYPCIIKYICIQTSSINIVRPHLSRQNENHMHNHPL